MKAGLDQDVRLGVIESVPIGTSVTWCYRVVICAKKTGKPRRTVDFQSLNAHATRETHRTQSPFHQVRVVPHGKWKSVFDAWNGYHCVAVDPADRHFATSITPWGRYRYVQQLKATLFQGMGIPAVMTRSLPTSPGRLSASMMHCYGPTRSSVASTRLHSG